MRMLVLSLVLLSACGSKKSDPPATEPAGSAAAKPAEPPPPKKKTPDECAGARKAAENLIVMRANFSQEVHVEASSFQLELLQHFTEGTATVEVAVRKASMGTAKVSNEALEKSDAAIKICHEAFTAKAADARAKCAAADAALMASLPAIEAASKVVDDVKLEAAKAVEAKKTFKNTIDGFATIKKASIETAVAALEGC